MSLLINDITDLHKQWIRIAIHCGANPVLAKDIVQEFYLKLLSIQEAEGNLNRISYKGEINKMYAFSMINNAVMSHFRKRKNLSFIPEMHESELGSTLDEKRWEYLMSKIESVIGGLNWYDRELFNLYITSGKSMRTLAKETQINLHNINRTIQKVKTIIRDECNVDFNLLYTTADEE